MLRLLNYYGRFESFRGNVTGLPGWARFILVILALPGMILIGLSIVAFVVSLLALLVLTVPVYRALSALTAPKPDPLQGEIVEESGVVSGPVAPEIRRHVEVKIVEPQ